MAALNLFAFRTGTTALHRLDVRTKIVLVCMVSLAVLAAGFIGCLACFLVLYGLVRTINVSFIRLLAQLQWFILLLFIMFLTSSLTIPGTPVFSLSGLMVTQEGMARGALVAVRFFLVMMTGLLFSATTRPATLKSAAQWFLRPIPLVPEKRVAIMISLFLRFLPLILDQAQQTSDAVNARCGNLHKNPVRRIRCLTLPVIKKTFLAADNLCLAMDARCFTENRTDPAFEKGGKEKMFLAAGAALCIGMVWQVPVSFWMTFWS
ncbi:MAG: energy-coupling factor transporter transmembrane protein EcfT [Desulfobacteraceae bacterium]|nr:energy-coupling factor transporter transmembrane protein EcfT [Desulfobacteraceae bacterium]